MNKCQCSNNCKKLTSLTYARGHHNKIKHVSAYNKNYTQRKRKITCVVCNKITKNKKYCSHKCLGIGYENREVSKETRQKCREAALSWNITEEERSKLIKKGMQKAIKRGWKPSLNIASPNKTELYLEKLLKDKISRDWRFTGNGQLIINGKYPDFWNGKNKLIELYGDYWHKNDNPQDRINIFKEVGYDCLVIWESEIKDNEEKCLNTIKFWEIF